MAITLDTHPTPQDSVVTKGRGAHTNMSVEAFEALVGPHLDKLFGFACQRSKKPADAEDLVQDTLLQAWNHIHTLQDLDRVRSWLFSILVNLHLERNRKAVRRNRLVPIEDKQDLSDVHVATQNISPLESVVRQSAADAVHEALARVPTPYAMALALRDIEGLAYKEVAQVLGVPVGTVMSRIARGRKMMAELLVEWRALPTHLKEHHTS